MLSIGGPKGRTVDAVRAALHLDSCQLDLPVLATLNVNRADLGHDWARASGVPGSPTRPPKQQPQPEDQLEKEGFNPPNGNDPNDDDERV